MGSLYEHIEALGKLRGYKNMTALCKSAGVPRSTMSELNAGRSKDISKPNAQKFADLLGVALDEIYRLEQKECTPTVSDEDAISKELIDLLLQMDTPEKVQAAKESLQLILKLTGK